MDLIQIDVIGLEPPQRVLTGFHNVVARDAPVVRSFTHLSIDLGCKDDLVTFAIASQRNADDPFAFARIVDIGSVDKVDPSIKRRVNDTDRIRLGGWIAEIHCAQAQRRNLYSSPSK